MTRVFHIECGGQHHPVRVESTGDVLFDACPDAFQIVEREAALAALGGVPAPTGYDGCLGLARAILRDDLFSGREGDVRKLLSVRRGLRVAQRLQEKTRR